LALGIWVVRRVRKINLPPGADPVTALLLTPLPVVILLDLLDFTFDFLSAPIAWAILTYLGLKPLRGVTVIESIIPATQAIPTMTLAWIAVRMFRRVHPWIRGYHSIQPSSILIAIRRSPSLIIGKIPLTFPNTHL
jgi:hypothetical protein